MTVVPQPTVQLRRATKADLPALLNLAEKQFQALENRNNPGALPTSCPTRPKQKPKPPDNYGMTVFSRRLFFPTPFL